MKFFIRVFVAWLPLGIAVTGLCLLVYVTVQQNYRQNLNDPQVQMAEDGAAALTTGAEPSELVQNPNAVDIANSLAPWLAVYNDDGVSIISSGTLNGDIPNIPKGVFGSARSNKGKDTDQPFENRITWQSGAGIRQALVVVHYVSHNDAGFVVAGRNMREIETREDQLSFFTLLAWITILIATFVAKLFAFVMREYLH